MKPNRYVKTKFLKVVCSKCKNEQNIFQKAAKNIECLVCGETLAESCGGKLKLKAKVIEELE